MQSDQFCAIQFHKNIDIAVGTGCPPCMGAEELCFINRLTGEVLLDILYIFLV